MRGFVSCFSPKFKEREKKKLCVFFFFLNVLRVSNPNFTTEGKKERKKERGVISSLFSERKSSKSVSLKSLSLCLLLRVEMCSLDLVMYTHAMNFLSRRTQ